MKLWVALGAYVVLAVLTVVTIDEQKFKLATLAILLMFAIRTLTWSRRMDQEQRDEEHRDEK